ncbi:tRNA (guanine(10)-N(2))-dimethyltransferase [Candidatus Thorarchaeota archaeon]|nr:MAG: tRNA (guanine(10)-N(2))-dimethyltransferase [Candidatus Thorarchaeota archaeon]
MTVEREYKEGKTTFSSADVEHYSKKKGQPTTSMPVFYNPRMRLNRDLSVIMLSGYLSKNLIGLMCEPLTGSGIRTLRYLNECDGNFNAKMFDANPNAVETSRKNLSRLGLDDRAEVKVGDAKMLLLTESRQKRFDFVDIDPFGSPTPYLNAAIQSLNPKGGLLAATATDMPALCGVYPRVALRKYGGVSIRAPFVHELAVRLLLGHIFAVAGANDCSMIPLAVLSTDHYIRVWTTVKADKKTANRRTADFGTVRYCPRCMRADSVPMREGEAEFSHGGECDGAVRSAGPLWIGNLYQSEFLDAAWAAFHHEDESIFHRRVSDILEKMLEEQHLTDYPYIDLHALCDLHNLPAPKNRDVIEHLREMKYRVARTHFSPTAIRTDAQPDVVAGVVRSIHKSG